MGYKFKKTLALLILTLLSVGIISGCIEQHQQNKQKNDFLQEKLDTPSILPNWKDGDYHEYYKTNDLLNELHIKYPDLVNVFSIGESVLGKEIWCIRITNEKNNHEKYTCLIDGCIHGCEWEAGEACLYLAEYLLINFENNETTKKILNATEIFIVPLVNPDGRQIDYRFNENGIDLNRNFAVDFGRIRGSVMPLGKVLGRKIPYVRFDRLHRLFPRFPLFLTNSGRRPFSQPEIRALIDLMINLESNKFAFYLNCHTAVHNLDIPWNAYKPPFKKSTHQEKIFNYVLDWVVENTEYENAEMNIEGYSYKASGTAMDWCFKEFKIPSFTFEILSQDYEPAAGGGKHDNLVHWMKTTLPVFLYLLVNVENLYNWYTPDIQPSLPEGIPPDPLK